MFGIDEKLLCICKKTQWAVGGKDPTRRWLMRRQAHKITQCVHVLKHILEGQQLAAIVLGDVGHLLTRGKNGTCAIVRYNKAEGDCVRYLQAAERTTSHEWQQASHHVISVSAPRPSPLAAQEACRDGHGCDYPCIQCALPLSDTHTWCVWQDNQP